MAQPTPDPDQLLEEMIREAREAREAPEAVEPEFEPEDADLLLQRMVEEAQEKEKVQEKRKDPEEIPPAKRPPLPPEVRPLNNPATGRPFDVLDLDEEELEAQGLDRVADRVRDFKATVFGKEGSQKLKHLYERNRQLPWGRFGYDPDEEVEDLTAFNLKALKLSAGITDWLDDSQWSDNPDPTLRLAEADTKRARMHQLAQAEAKRTVAGILGTDEARQNYVVDLDPEMTEERIARGQTLLGRLTTIGLVRDALDYIKPRVAGTVLEEPVSWVDRANEIGARFMAPFYAMGQPGGKSVQARGEGVEGGEDRPVMGMQKESTLNWFFRAGLWSVVGAVAFDPDLHVASKGVLAPGERILKYWGSPEHIHRIYSEGYDVTQEMRPLGKLVADATPWVEPEWMEQLIGFMGIMGLVLFEPDLVTLTTMGAGKVAKVAKGLPLLGEVAAPTLKMLDNVFMPQMKMMLRLLKEEGKSIEEVLASVPNDGPLRSLKNALLVHWNSDMLAEGMKFHGTKLADAPRAIERSKEMMAEGLKRLQEKRASRAAIPNKKAQEAQNLLDEATAQLEYVEAEQNLVRGLVHLLEQENLQKEILERMALGEFGSRSLRNLKKRYSPPVVQSRLTNYGLQEAALQSKIADLAEGAEKAQLVEQLRKLRSDQFTELGRQQQIADHLRTYESLRSGRREQIKSLRELGTTVSAYLKTNNIRISPEFGRVLQDQSLLTKALNRAEDIANPNRFSELKTVLRAAQSASTRSFERLKGLAAGAEDLAAEGHRLREAAAKSGDEFEQIGKEIDELERGFKAAENAEGIMADVLEQNINAARLVRSRLLKGEALDGTDEVLGYADSVAGSIWRSVDDIPKKITVDARDAWLEKVQERYGMAAVQDAIMGSPLVGERFVTLKLPRDQIVRQMLDVERLARRASRGPSEMATLKLAIDDVIETKFTSEFSSRLYERFLAAGMTVGARLAKLTDPVLARGLNRSPQAIKDIYRQAAETYQSASVHAGRILRDHNPEALLRFLTTSERFDVGHTIATFNQAGMTPHQKWWAHLKSIVDEDDVWSADIGAQAIARSALRPGFTGRAAAPRALRKFREMVRDSENADDLLAELLDPSGPLGTVVRKVDGATDAEIKIRQFVYKGILHGAVQHDAVRGLMKEVGPGLSSQAANALNFFTQDLPKGQSITVQAADAIEARRLMEEFRLPLTQELERKPLDPTALFSRMMTDSSKVANELVRLATVNGATVVVPRYIRDVMNDIGQGISKELQQFNEPGGSLWRNIKGYFSMWRLSVVNGWFFPRIAQFGTTYVGDWSQLVSSLGFREGSKIALQNTISYIPFLGLKLNDRLARAPGLRMTSALTNPTMNRLMQADPELRLLTKDGPMSGPEILEAARRQGALDSISSDDIAALMERGGSKGFRFGLSENVGVDIPRSLLKRAEAIGLWGPSHPVRASAEYLEAAQHRVRTQVFFEALQKGASEVEAGALMRRTMLDFRMGVTPWEMASIGQIATFWTFRRQQLSQMGGFFADAAAARNVGPLWRVLTGNTAIGRTRKYGQLIEAVPEAIYWGDPELRLNDEEQIHQWAIRSSPHWRGAEPILFSYRMSPEKELWYSEVLGKHVTYEQLALPGLTTLDAIQTYHNMANTALASALWAYRPSNLTIDDVDRVWAANVRDFSDTLNPGLDTLVNRALGGEERTSTRGVGVPLNQALLLNRLGWGDFLQTYTDKYGRKRYVTDPNILTLVGRLLMYTPPVENLAQSYAMFDVPGYSESMSRGLAESFFRFTGLVRFAQMDPVKTKEWAVINQDREFHEAIKDAKSRARER